MSPDVRFDHLARLTTPLGLFEHALGAEPRTEHGFCVDDVARALVVTARVPDPSALVRRLRATYLDFVLMAQRDDGLMHNRRDADGAWVDAATSDDHWGRALWALGVAVSELDDPVLVHRAREGAAKALRARSRWPRAMAYGALGAALLLRTDPADRAARQLLQNARPTLGRLRPSSVWPWPQARLTYANAVLPEAMIAVGAGLDDAALRSDGLALLGWLVDQQTVDGHLSVVPSGGRSPGRRGIAYAQQPIEVAALAEACRSAYVATADDRWAAVVELCVAWFDGANDRGVVMHEASTGGGYDGLEAHGPNLNQGAESTLAWLETAQVGSMPMLAAAR